MLIALIAIPLAGGALALAAAQRSPWLCRCMSLGALIADAVLFVAGPLVTSTGANIGRGSRIDQASELFAFGVPGTSWLAEINVPWLPEVGVHLHLGIDGFSALLVLLTLLLGLIAVAASWTEIISRPGTFHFCLLWVLAGVIGVFVALDLFLFFFFWELMLVPMYLLIAIWGHEQRIYAATKFFIFTQASGLLMLASIIALALTQYRATGIPSFDYADLRATAPSGTTGMLLMLGFFVAFAVKLPVVPLHSWLADAHTEAPTGGSVVLAGLLLKTGAYGLLRFAIPLFPDASRQFAPVAMTLGVVGILYGALLATAQNDAKRLVAYTSISHLGFVLLGVYSFTRAGTDGAVIQIIAHGLSTGGLFVLVGALQERLHTRDLRTFEGLWSVVPRAASTGLVFALASLGLPGLGNFVAEFLVLAGAFRTSPALSATACVGLVLAAIYALVFVQRAFLGPLRLPDSRTAPRDLAVREVSTLAVLVVLLVGLGLFPQPVIDEVHSTDAVGAAVPASAITKVDPP